METRISTTKSRVTLTLLASFATIVANQAIIHRTANNLRRFTSVQPIPMPVWARSKTAKNQRSRLK